MPERWFNKLLHGSLEKPFLYFRFKISLKAVVFEAANVTVDIHHGIREKD